MRRILFAAFMVLVCGSTHAANERENRIITALVGGNIAVAFGDACKFDTSHLKNNLNELMLVSMGEKYLNKANAELAKVKEVLHLPSPDDKVQCAASKQMMDNAMTILDEIKKK